VKRLGILAATVLAVNLVACGGGGGGGDDDDVHTPDAGPVDFTKCSGSDESYVRNASLAILGRRPLSEAEVDVYAQILRGVRAKDVAAGQPDDAQHARRVVARVLMQNPEYVERWTRHFMDRLRVIRSDDQDMKECYGATKRDPDDGALARAVLAGKPTTPVAGGEFTMRDLLRSAVVADDVTPAYRAHLFELVSRAIPAANVPDKEAELARREDFGNTFDAVYMNRDIVCLGCHNSEMSTTDRDDPKEDRFWPVPGLFEKSLYHVSTGVDPKQAHAMFRYADFYAQDQGSHPWGWSDACGTFEKTVPDDTLTGVSAVFGKLSGAHVTVYDTEASLARGFQALREDGLVLAADGTIADADTAFAYLVAMNIVDGVWSEVTGGSLVIANYFPRNEASRDILHLLTEKYVASGFSLQAVLEEIVVGPYFDRLPPSAGCGTGPYNMPAVYDPWVRSDEVEERRQNGAGDGVHALTTRTAANAAYTALGWPTTAAQDFPTPDDCDQAADDCNTLFGVCHGLGVCCSQYHDYCELHLPPPDLTAFEDERAFQSGTGMFLTNAERGFRGMEFQARLEWENRFARCTAPAVMGAGVMPDFVDGLVTRAKASTTATLRDAVLALKDRLVADASIAPGAETTGLEAILGQSLDTPASGVSDLDTKLRQVCGVLMSSPQFLLGGQSAQAAPPVPLLTPTETAFEAVCARVAALPLTGGLHVSCAAGSLTVE
jgi:hypothetical protein